MLLKEYVYGQTGIIIITTTTTTTTTNTTQPTIIPLPPPLRLKGRVVCKIYPLSQAGLVKSVLPDWARGSDS